jgi:hypothetical protein
LEGHSYLVILDNNIVMTGVQGDFLLFVSFEKYSINHTGY